MQIDIDGRRLVLVQGDITHQDVDVVVNAANRGLRGGGGVDGAIHRAGGPDIMTECREIGRCPTGGARITTAGRLKTKKVIHAVGPVYRGGGSGEAQLLADAYENSLELASQHSLTTVAFPSISTGAYGYPLNEAAGIALTTVIQYMRAHPEITEVRFVLFGPEACAAYEKALSECMDRSNPDSG